METPISKLDCPTPEDMALDLAEHLANLTRHRRAPIAAQEAAMIRGFYHVGGHAAAIRRALYAEQAYADLHASVEARVARLEEVLRTVAEALEKRQACRAVWCDEPPRHCRECDERDHAAASAARAALEDKP